MKSTGSARRIDDLGRIVIPKEIRNNLRIRKGDGLEFFIDNDMVILKKYGLKCVYCGGTMGDRKSSHISGLCPKCLAKLEDK